jgi:hypothetical protein
MGVIRVYMYNLWGIMADGIGGMGWSFLHECGKLVAWVHFSITLLLF